MFKAAIADPSPNYAERRTSARYTVHIEATLHAGGKAQSTIVDDLSTGGAGLNGAIGIYANDDIEIEFADGRRLAAKVAWWLSGCCGIQFREPLQPNDPIFAVAKK
jgi:hypothetical protein